MEIEGLCQKQIKPIKHFYDVIKNPPVSYFDNESVRIQDFLLNLRTVYGDIQGYYFTDKLIDLSALIERLAYTREIYVCLESDGNSIPSITKIIFPHGRRNKNYQVWESRFEGKNYYLFRIITNIFFLEQINNVILCSSGKTRKRQIERMDENLNRLFKHIMGGIRYYIPKFPKDYNWKEFEDFVDEPNEITLYLTQFYGPPYKAKFHPRMIRALINFSNIIPGHTTGDFMLGSGTLAIESVFLNIETKGSDVNPLTEIVAKAKTDALSFDPTDLLTKIEDIRNYLTQAKTTVSPDIKISPETIDFFSKKQTVLKQAITLREYIETKLDSEYKNFFLSALASEISRAFKKKNEPNLFTMVEDEIWKMWKVVYCFNKIQKVLHVPLNKATIRTDDIRTLKKFKNNSIDLIVTSPPYSTAIDYVRMDLPQLLLLGLIKDQEELDAKMMGTHRTTSDLNTLSNHIAESKPLLLDEKNRFHKLPLEAREYILDLKDAGNMRNALRCYKFLYDMWDALTQMHRVLKPKGKCIIIIGNNVFRVKGEKREFRNGDFLEEMALNKEIGFFKWHEKLVREYSKSSFGTILKEDILFLEKPRVVR